MNRNALRMLSLILALCITLTACGGGKTAAPFDPEATATALLDSGAFHDALDTVDTTAICDAYGIDQATVTGCTAYLSLSAGAEELTVFTLRTAEDAKTALDALNRRVADQIESLTAYQPEEVSKLEQAIVLQRENSVLLVVAADAEAAQKIIDGV